MRLVVTSLRKDRHGAEKTGPAHLTCISNHPNANLQPFPGTLSFPADDLENHQAPTGVFASLRRMSAFDGSRSDRPDGTRAFNQRLEPRAGRKGIAAFSTATTANQALL